MKLEKVLDLLNAFEKNSFLKIVDGIISDSPRKAKEIEGILSDHEKDLKNIDNIKVSKIFTLVQDEFIDVIKQKFNNPTSQFDLLIDIIIRDGNCIMKQEWFYRLYEVELKKIGSKSKNLETNLYNGKSDLDKTRKKDYLIYHACIETAYSNDLKNNQHQKITEDEQSILNTLAQQLDLSQDEVKLINYMSVPLKKLDINHIITDLKNAGVIFYAKKSNMVYVADEIVAILRKIRNKEIADKHYRRVLRHLTEPEINLICRKHNIEWRGVPLDAKVSEIINEGTSFSSTLINDIYKDGSTLTEKKKTVDNLIENNLKISFSSKGVTIEDKVEKLITYFNELEKDDIIGISHDGFENLLIDLNKDLPKFNNQVRKEFELQDEYVLKGDYLLDYNIKPRDILNTLSQDDLNIFCKSRSIKTRGNKIFNILETYKDTENIYLENYHLFALRDLKSLKENGINVKESKIGIKYEDLTKAIFSKLGFDVDESLRKKINNKTNKIDLVINLGNNDVILVECKTVKEKGYNKYSTVSRQLKAYANRANKHKYKVVKSLLVAPDFSDEFVSECSYEYDLNLSLITAGSLYKILKQFNDSNMGKFPYKLFMRDILIQEDRILKALMN